MRIAFKIALLVAALLCIGAVFLIDVVPPRSATAGSMLITKRRIIRYAHQYNHLPALLSELPPMPNYDTATTDAWGRPFDYSFTTSGTVTLRSLGADKQIGGDGDNRDMIGVFAVRDLRENWQDELCPWTKDPLKP